MANHDPLEGRQKAREKRQKAAGDVAALRAVLWKFITRLQQHIEEQPTIDAEVLRAGHALIQAGGLFLKSVEVGELEARIARLEGRPSHESTDAD